MREECCKNCKFYEPMGPEKGGYCQRFPPQAGSSGVISEDYIEVSYYFPVVVDCEWCGEFKQKEAK